MIKKAVYTALQGGEIVVEYNHEAPCRMCGQPVIEASMGGTDVCPWCDCGYNRDGIRWTYEDYKKVMKRNNEHLYATTGGHPP